MNTPLPHSIGRPATNALAAASITCLEDLTTVSEKELSAMHGVGPKAILLLQQALKESNICLSAPSTVQPKKTEVIDGYTIKYHANGMSRWSKGIIRNGQADGYWEWYRADGTLKRSGYFILGEATGEWTTYDANGSPYKVTQR